MKYAASEHSQKSSENRIGDIYGFGWIIYELCTLENPPTELEKMKIIPNEALRKLFESCLRCDTFHQPSFPKIVEELERISKTSEELDYVNNFWRENFTFEDVSWEIFYPCLYQKFILPEMILVTEKVYGNKWKPEMSMTAQKIIFGDLFLDEVQMKKCIKILLSTEKDGSTVVSFTRWKLWCDWVQWPHNVYTSLVGKEIFPRI
jgi:hypothetical protein